MSSSGPSTNADYTKNWIIALTALPLAAYAFWRAYFDDQANTTLVFAEVAAAYVVIQAAIESASITNVRMKEYLTYFIKVISAVIAACAVYAA